MIEIAFAVPWPVTWSTYTGVLYVLGTPGFATFDDAVMLQPDQLTLGHVRGHWLITSPPVLSVVTLYGRPYAVAGPTPTLRFWIDSWTPGHVCCNQLGGFHTYERVVCRGHALPPLEVPPLEVQPL